MPSPLGDGVRAGEEAHFIRKGREKRSWLMHRRSGCKRRTPRRRKWSPGSRLPKSVNHRFLDLHFRLPSNSDSLEMQLRRLLKEKMARGTRRSYNQPGARKPAKRFALNRPLVSAYIAAFRAAAAEFSVSADPDLNVILRIPGVLDSASDPEDGALESAVMTRVGDALDRLNEMREQEGRSIGHELRQRMGQLREAVKTVQLHRRRRSYTAMWNASRRGFWSFWAPAPTKNVRCRRPLCWLIAVIFRRKSSGWKITS